MWKKYGLRTHNIYFVLFNGERWKEFVWFRDCLNTNIGLAKNYERLKNELSRKYCDDIHKYTEGKSEFITNVLKNYEEQIKK